MICTQQRVIFENVCVCTCDLLLLKVYFVQCGPEGRTLLIIYVLLVVLPESTKYVL